MTGGGACMVLWEGACVTGGMHDRGVCMTGGLCDRWGGMRDRRGVCMTGGGHAWFYGRGACIVLFGGACVTGGVHDGGHA